MKINIRILLYLLGFLLLYGCSSSTETESKNNPPADHTINKDGIMHKSGLNDPETNCVSCHGADLRGGNVSVSCYQCHGKKW